MRLNCTVPLFGFTADYFCVLALGSFECVIRFVCFVLVSIELF